MTRIKSVITAIVMVFTSIFNLIFFPVSPETESVIFARNLGPGWNLGNSLDAWREPEPVDTETCWGNPKTTKELISFVKEAGFNSVRIPVTWFQHVDKNYNIEKEWLDRVNEIVNFVLDSGMYAIINVHHDDKSWLITNSENEEKATEILKKIWSQVAERFASYDEKLVFETMNEPRVVGADFEWSGNDEARKVVNRLNFAALETIRNSGGNNKSRYVFISSYAGSISKDNYKAIEVPDDSRVMVSLHYYYGTSHDGAFLDCSKKLNLGDKREMYKTFRGVYKTFVKKGVGVSITEFGWTDRENLENLAEKAEFFADTASKFSMSCIVWDNGEIFRLLDRRNLSAEFPSYVEAIT